MSNQIARHLSFPIQNAPMSCTIPSEMFPLPGDVFVYALCYLSLTDLVRMRFVHSRIDHLIKSSTYLWKKRQVSLRDPVLINLCDDDDMYVQLRTCKFIVRSLASFMDDGGLDTIDRFDGPRLCRFESVSKPSIPII